MNLMSPIVQRWIEDAREDPEAFWGKRPNSCRGSAPGIVCLSGHRPRSAGSLAGRRIWPTMRSTIMSSAAGGAYRVGLSQRTRRATIVYVCAATSRG